MATKSTHPTRWSESFRVKVAPATFQQAKELAEQRQTTISQLTRLALSRFLDEEKAR
ncbi:hypothetical protein BH18ACT12_BH18ACT12_20670 [soil metagenome]